MTQTRNSSPRPDLLTPRALRAGFLAVCMAFALVACGTAPALSQGTATEMPGPDNTSP
jgi:hypothetical protein